ncbi:serine hydrolase domain-containing protein [Glycocaulis abyssi]|uniref:Serine hydrolase domain-containing protein n=1 Tax=Glycocaulis abyssi TaxID=1433403 RepID=A0ABV9N842_9PROT
MSDPRWPLSSSLIGAALLAASLAACSQPAVSTAEAVSETVPAARTLNGAGLATLDATLETFAAAQARSGYVALIARDGVVQHISETGFADIESARPMTADTMVRIASMTKPVTAAAIMQLAEDGALSLDQPLADIIPAFADTRVAVSVSANGEGEIETVAAERAITIEDLLTHTSGIGYVFDYETDLGRLYLTRNVYEDREMTLEERIDHLAGLPLYFQPGERWYYSWSNDILGRVVEVVSGQDLESYMQAHIFQPLGMDNTTFFPGEEHREQIATLYTHDENGAIQPVPTSLDYAFGANVAAGGAGLFSTANDFFRFAQALANGGELDRTRILSADSVAAMSQVHVGADRMPANMNAGNLGFGYSLGVVYEGQGSSASGYPADFGWGGYFDTDFFVSPSTGVVALILAQEQPSATSPREGARAIFREHIQAVIGE